MVTHPVLHEKIMNSWALNALMTAPYLLIRGLTSIFFINENASLPKAARCYSHPSIEREHLVFLSSLDESFDGNASILKGSLIASRLVVHERLGGSAERAHNRFNSANKSLIFSIPKKKSRNERPNY